MAWGWAKGLLDRLGAPELDWVQVEITTRCDARCVYCPRTAMGSGWPARHMPLDLFRSLLRCLGQTRQAHLQGWGEPLLNPQLLEMIRLCKGRGLQVSTTTNGNALDGDMARALVAAGLDVLGVSLAGTRSQTNDALRVGTSLERLAAGLARLAGAKARAGVGLPQVHLAYLDLGSAPEELFALPALARDLGIARIMLSTPSPLATPQASMPPLAPAQATAAQELAGREALLEELARQSAALGVELFWSARLLRESGRICTENPSGACVVGVDGQVTPCVFGAAVLGEGQDGPRPDARPLVFGNIRERSLTDIWHGEEYARFRALFEPQGPEDGAPWPEPCARCPLRARAVPD